MIENELYDLSTGKKKSVNNWLGSKEDLQKLANEHRVLSPLNETIYSEKKFFLTAEKKEFLKIVLTYFHQEQIDYLLIKGIVSSKYYPSTIIRQISDIDMLIKDINHFWKAALYLIENGFDYEYVPMISKINEKYYCVAAFEKIMPNKEKVNIELNVGGFLFSEYFWLDEKELWNEKSVMKLDQTEIFIPNDFYNFLILICEAGGNEHFRIRDAVDYKFFSEMKVDTVKLEKLLKKYEIVNDYKKLKDLTRFFENGESVKTLLKKNRLRSRWFNQLIPSIFKRKISFSQSLLQFLWLKGNQKMMKNQFVTIFSKIGTFLENINAFEYGMMNHLIPISEKSGPMQVRKKGNRRYMISPVGTFLLSNFCIMEDENIDEQFN